MQIRVEKRFELALLLQSFVMIFAQLFLLQLIVRLKAGTFDAEYVPTHGTSAMHKNLAPTCPLGFGNFWQWNDYHKYLLFLSGFSAVCGTISIINVFTLRWIVYTEILGTLALMTEATLAMPQLYQNYLLKSTRGLRYPYFRLSSP